MTTGTNGHVAVWPGGDGNEAYLDKTLRFNDIELSLDESVNFRILWRLWLRAFIVSGVVWAVFAVPGVVLMFSDAGSVLGGGASSGGGTVLVTVGTIPGVIMFWLILLLSKLPEPIAEWRVLLADRAAGADSVYSQISGTLWHRQLPVNWRVRRIRTGFGPSNVSNRLVVQDRTYTAYISVFPYGTSLYLGWMMWRTRRGTTLIGRFVADVFSGMGNGQDLERQMMRTERPRAMREAVHAACREGLMVAHEGRQVPVEYGFPQGLPQIEPDELGSAPVPVPRS